jgi:hypothetical protein
MKDTVKSIIKSFVRELIASEMSAEQLEVYLQSDLSKMPAEWLREQEGEVTETEMKSYLDDSFPETKEKANV